MALTIQQINVNFTGVTGSNFFTAPSQQTTILDATNTAYLRQIFLNNQGVKIVSPRANFVIQIPMTQLMQAAISASPSMSWAPAIVSQPTSSTVTHPTASYFAVSASSETALTYLWQTAGTGSTNFYNFASDISASVLSGSTAQFMTASTTTGLNGYAFRCILTNSSGNTTSSTAILTVL